MSSRQLATFKVTTSKAIKATIDEWTAFGNYTSPGAFIEEAVREKLDRAAKKRLEQLLLDGINSGPGIPVTDEFWREIESKALSQIRTRKKSKRGRSA